MTSEIWDKGSVRNLALTSVLVILILAFHMEAVTPQIIDCARIMMRVAKGLLKTYARCSKEFLRQLGDDKVEYNRRVHCVMKCVMDRIGILDEYDKVTNDTMQVFFDKFIPPELHEIGQIMVEGCIEEFSPLMSNDLEDDTCHPWGGYVACVQNIVAEAC